MSRTRIDRTLPPIEEVFHSFKGFSGRKSKQGELEDLLREAACRLRKKEAQPFYSMRDIVRFFQLPLRSVALAYQTLEHEGLLNRHRSTVTMLSGHEMKPRKPIRAVVGVPIRLHDMVVSSYARGLYLRLEEQLRKRGFVADLIFYRARELASPDFAHRLLSHNVDVLIWHSNTSLPNQQTLLTLKDAGVRLLLIHSKDLQTSLPLSSYQLDWQPAYQQLAKVWVETGIQHVVIPDPTETLNRKHVIAGFCNLFNTVGIHTHLVACNALNISERISKICRDGEVGVAFLDTWGAERICTGSPNLVESLLPKARFAFCRGAIRAPYFDHHTERVDLIVLNAERIAEQIAIDLSRSPSLPEEILFSFDAELDLQRPLFTIYEEL